MFRSILIVAAFLCACQCPTANAKGRIGKWLRGARNHTAAHHGHHHGHHASHSSPSLMGFGIGVGSYPGYGYGVDPGYSYVDPYRFDGFGYDPYKYGSFRAPDLMDDPYFIQQHRHESRFPGRYRKH